MTTAFPGEQAMVEVTTLGRWCGVFVVEFWLLPFLLKNVFGWDAAFVDTKEVFETVWSADFLIGSI